MISPFSGQTSENRRLGQDLSLVLEEPDSWGFLVSVFLDCAVLGVNDADCDCLKLRYLNSL